MRTASPGSANRVFQRHRLDADRLADGSVGELPAWVLRPRARLWSSRHACCQPLSASATAYGMVALVSAYVDVFGTAPGMFATQ